MSVEFLTSIIPMLFRGLKLTMLIAVVGILLGFVLGSISGYALQCKNKVARTIANIYIYIYIYMDHPRYAVGRSGIVCILRSSGHRDTDHEGAFYD